MKDDWEKYRSTHPVKKNIDYMRRRDIFRQTEAEKAIMKAVEEVEKLSADTRLSWAVTRLNAAFEFVADFVDDVSSDETATEEIDPTPYCTGCGAMTEKKCKCGPIAEND